MLKILKRASNNHNRHNIQRAQTLVEYTTVIVVVIGAIIAMSPLFQRSIQGMIKVVADKVGVQENSDQRFDDTGHLVFSYTTTRVAANKELQEWVGDMTYVYNDIIDTSIHSFSNLGFIEEVDQ